MFENLNNIKPTKRPKYRRVGMNIVNNRTGLTIPHEELADELNRLQAVAIEAHKVILHEMDSGRTPHMLKSENGGKGLGYFEDSL